MLWAESKKIQGKNEKKLKCSHKVNFYILKEKVWRRLGRTLRLGCVEQFYVKGALRELVAKRNTQKRSDGHGNLQCKRRGGKVLGVHRTLKKQKDLRLWDAKK